VTCQFQVQGLFIYADSATSHPLDLDPRRKCKQHVGYFFKVLFPGVKCNMSDSYMEILSEEALTRYKHKLEVVRLSDCSCQSPAE